MQDRLPISPEHQLLVEDIVSTLNDALANFSQWLALFEEAKTFLFYRAVDCSAGGPRETLFKVFVLKPIREAAEFEDERKYLVGLVFEKIVPILTWHFANKYHERTGTPNEPVTA